MEVKYIDGTYARSLIRERAENSSKGDFGTLAMLCGSRHMTGAAVLSAYGALRSGVGLLRLLGHEEVLTRLQNVLFEPVFAPVEGFDFSKCSAFLCGCGIGREYDEILPALLEKCKVNAVLDADCINFIAVNKYPLRELQCNITLTPHPGEMARLTGRTIAEIQQDRVGFANAFAVGNRCIVVLKGHGTVIAAPDGRVIINTTGSSALSKGGSGDVLAGVIASLNAQGYDSFDAAVLGVYLHGLAGDILSEKLGKSGVIPSDLPKEIGRLLC